MKRKLCILLVLLTLFFALTSCGETKDPDLNFTNHLTTVVHNFYVSPVGDDDWSDPVSLAKISSGSTISFDFTKIAENAGPGVYDLGAIDENAMNYDAYDVPLAVGDQIDLAGDADSAEFTVTHADGQADHYEAFIYSNDG